MGRSGREAIVERLPMLRKKQSLDFVVANCENATQGRGITVAHANILLAAGIDCMTLGDHAFDQKDIVRLLETDARILRPINYSKAAPGRGARIYSLPNQRKILIIAALGRVFMRPAFNDPFGAVQDVLSANPIGTMLNAAVLDFHAEATSEKTAMGIWCDGKASLVAGTHTHIPTADARVLPGGTAYVTDVGMSGDYESVIGVDNAEPIKRFTTGMTGGKLVPASGQATLSGAIVDINPATGLANAITSLRSGGILGTDEVA